MSDIRVVTINGRKDVKGSVDGKLLLSGDIKEIEESKIIAATTDYAAEDVLSDTNATMWRFAKMAAYPGGAGRIKKAQILCSTTALSPQLTLYLFSKKPTSALTDNGANTAVITADRTFSQGRIDFSAMEDLGGNSSSLVTESTYGNLPLDFLCAPLDINLYGILVTRTAITGEVANMEIYIKLLVEQW